MSREQEKRDNENYSKNFTRVPNIVFVSYKHLTKEEKFLYCTIRQVYWDLKPRFLSTRELSESTGYSRGALANMLPRLNDCGLIHAEIKREKGKDGKEKGNAKYHITIPDIWELNRKYFEASLEEQARMDPSLKLAQEMDRNSSPLNGQACPPNEPSLSTKKAKPGSFSGQDKPHKASPQANPQRSKDSNKDITKDLLKERKNDDLPTNDTLKDSFSPSFTSSLENEVEFSFEEEAIYDFGKQTIFKANPPEKTQKVKEQCAKIAEAGINTLEQMISLVAFTKQETGFGTLHLGNLINALNGWMLTQQFPTVLSSKSRTTSKVLSSYDDEDYIDDTFYKARKVEAINGKH